MPDDGPLPPARSAVGGARRTPCVGVCSTTYGDLVCRGCKRFAHEIVAWNGYRNCQQELIRKRLRRLLAQSVLVHVRIVDGARLRSAARRAGVEEQATLEELAFQTMRRRRLLPLPSLGLAAVGDDRLETAAALTAIDREFYLRSQAHYEASFRIPAT